MNTSSAGNMVLNIGAQVDGQSFSRAEREILNLPAALEKEFERIWKITKSEAREFVQGTTKDMSETWEKTHKDMKSIATDSLKGTVVAWFKGDMDSVEDIWENAWQSMIGKADKLWDGFLNKAAGRMKQLLPNNKGPEVSPGALSFRLAA